MDNKKKLIEVALPLEAINKASAREKSIRHGHPSTLHLWWARRPLAAARAVIFAQMVDDPSAHPDLFTTEEAQEEERQRLFRIIEELVKWENTTNEKVLRQARDEIWRSWRYTCAENADHPQAKELFNPEKLPAFHDPFAGGGTLPLEAQRLGLESYASDLNPVAVLINKAMIEIPPKFANRPPVNPESRNNAMSGGSWKGAAGLAEDVRYYGKWMRDEAEKRIGHLYPKIEITDEMVAGSAGVSPARLDLQAYVGQKLTVIAWLWARTVKSPNPAFSEVDVPLVSTFMLSTKAGKEAYVEPVILGARVSRPHEGDGAAKMAALPGYRFTVKPGGPTDAEVAKNGTKLSRGANFLCLMSGSPIAGDYIKAEGKAGRMGARLMAIVAEGERGRVYLAPTPEMEVIALTAQPTWKPETPLPDDPRNFWTIPYGLTTFGDLFTPRQLVALTTFSDLVQEARERIKHDALGARSSRAPAGETPALPNLPRPRKEWHTRGYLPHWEAGEIPQSITFRLYDSLPQTLLDQQRYRLHAWVVMPNHVHVLVTPLHDYSLSSILHSWKSFTAKEANKLLGRGGAFWLEEYFDRAVRDENHFRRVIEYIDYNPVKAGLCVQPEDWPFTSAKRHGLGAQASCLPEEERAGRPRSQDEVPLAEGGVGATAYADAVGVYVGMAVSKMADAQSSLCRWKTTMDQSIATFGRQALPMVWDYSEANAFSEMAGDPLMSLKNMMRVVDQLPAQFPGNVRQDNAQSQSISTDKVVSTDPPYYDNIGYADLSDFFYVWLRRSLRPIFPELFATLAVPKAEELVATPYRHGSKQKAEAFFLDGMTQAMRRLAEQSHPAFPVTIYYAFKQAESDGDDGTTNTGWDTFLAAVIEAGFAISGTWPMRTELSNRMIGSGTNALASSIVLVCRKRPDNAPTATRREFAAALKADLPAALRQLQGLGARASRPPEDGETAKMAALPGIAPVDLAQAAIGPGMAVYTRYAKVLDAEGKPVPVREALALINQTLDEALAEQEGDFDADSRWALAWFEQMGFNDGPFGDAETLSTAKNTSVAGLVEAQILVSSRGKVRLLQPSELPADWNPQTDQRLTHWETVHHLIRALESGGDQAAAALVVKLGAQAETARELCYRLYTLCERKKRATEALAYNGLVQSWPEITRLARELGGSKVEPKQADWL